MYETTSHVLLCITFFSFIHENDEREELESRVKIYKSYSLTSVRTKLEIELFIRNEAKKFLSSK